MLPVGTDEVCACCGECRRHCVCSSACSDNDSYRIGMCWECDEEAEGD